MAASGEHTSSRTSSGGARGPSILGPDHPDTLATRFAIAQAMARGDNAVETALRKVLAARRDAGPGPPGHAGHPVAIARETGGARDRRAVVKAFRHVLAVRQRTWGRITRTRCPPGSPSPGRWRRAAATRRRRTTSGICSRPGSDGDRSPGHAGHPVQHCPGDGGLGPRNSSGRAGEARALGLDHPDTLIVRFNIAREVAARGRPGAEKEFRLLPHMGVKAGTRSRLHASIAQEAVGSGGRGRVPGGALFSL